jgi:RHS repeat-associated protein
MDAYDDKTMTCSTVHANGKSAAGIAVRLGMSSVTRRFSSAAGLAAAFVLTSFAGSAHAAQIDERLPVEAVMREIEARLEALGMTPASWPTCDCSGLGTLAPTKPPTGFYQDCWFEDEQNTATLVAEILGEFSELMGGEFLIPENHSLEGKEDFVYESELGNPHYDLADFDLDSIIVTDENYKEVFGKIRAALGKLTHSPVVGWYPQDGCSVSRSLINYYVGECLTDPGTDGYCGFDGCADTPGDMKIQAAGWFDCDEAFLLPFEWSCTGATSAGWSEGNSAYISEAGCVSAGYVAECGTGISLSKLKVGANPPTGTLKLYLKGFTNGGDTEHAPIAIDELYHAFGESAETLYGVSWVSEMIGPVDEMGEEFELDTPSETLVHGFDEWPAPACTAEFSESNDWYIDDFLGVVVLRLDTSPNGEEFCGNISSSMTDATTAPDSEVGSEGNGSPGTCGAPGGKGPGPGGNKRKAPPPSRGGPKNSPEEESTDIELPEGITPEDLWLFNNGKRYALPVDLVTGTKSEQTTDLSLPSLGGGIVLARSYSSKTDLGGSELLGAGWSSNLFPFIRSVSGSVKVLDGWPSDGKITFNGSGPWYANGASTLALSESTYTLRGDEHDTWKLSDPGAWEMHFYRDPTDDALEGLPLVELDMYGNVIEFQYAVYSATACRPIAIRVNPDGEGRAMGGEILLQWFDDSADAAQRGKLRSANAYQIDDTGNSLLTQRVEYHYFLDEWIDNTPANTRPWLGTPGDLIQVDSYVRVDDAPEGIDPFHVSVTQYRYHDGEPHSNGDERLAVSGEPHQLKAVIAPQQIEFLSQQEREEAEDDVVDGAEVLDTAARLLTVADGSDAFSGASNDLVDYFAKIVKYSSSSPYRVTDQYIQAGCGCASGSSQSKKVSFAYLGSVSHPTARVNEYVFDGSVFNLFKTSYSDFKYLDSGTIPYLLNKVVVDPADAERLWVWRIEYNESTRDAIRFFMPSAVDSSSYTAATVGTAASVDTKADEGLAYAAEYDANHEITEFRVGEGDLVASASTSDTLTKYYYEIVGRPWLISKVEQFSSDVTSPTADQTETTTFAYTYHSGDTVASIATTVEAEKTAENGDGSTTFTSYSLYNARGQRTWTRDESGVLAYHRYDPRNGKSSLSSTNTSTDSPAGFVEDALDGDDFGGLSVSGWTSGEGGAHTTSTRYDALGRPIESEVMSLHGGIRNYVVRTITASEDRPGVAYMATYMLPHQLDDDSFEGTASRTITDAEGSSISTEEFEVDGGEDYDPREIEFTLADRAARMVQVHSFTGRLMASRAYPFADGVDYYETLRAYDRLGRIASIRSADGTYNVLTHDLFDRVVETKVGTSLSPDNTEIVSERYFDHSIDPMTGDPEFYIGDGNLTVTRSFTGEDSGAEFRQTVKVYDWRNRVISVQPPLGPYTFTTYDNLNRPVEQGVFGTVPSTISSSDRASYTKTYYSQRGLSYRQEVAIDASDLGDGYLQANSWFDPAGRIAASGGPNLPTLKHVYDGVGRETTTYATDGSGTDPWSVTGDRVIEQTNTRFNSAGWVDFTTTYQRQPGSTATGPLDDSGHADADKGVPIYTGIYFDEVGRPIRTVNFGTAASDDTFSVGATDPSESWPDTLPEIDDDENGIDSDKIITGVEYDQRGRATQLFDSHLDETASADHQRRKRWTRTYFDDLGRVYATVENYVPSSGLTIAWDSGEGRWEVTAGLSPSTPDQNRVTSFVLDSIGNQVKRVAHLPHASNPEQVQVTQYNYGITATSGSSGDADDDNYIDHGGLLASVQYPDESTGAPGTSGYTTSYRYNRLGELKWTKDQNGTEHSFLRDETGRVVKDKAFALGTDIDGAVRAIKISYDAVGRLDKVESTSDTSGSTVVNAVRYRYTPLWQIAKLYQDVNGVVQTTSGDPDAAPINDTRVVQYTYSDSSSANYNRSRLASLTYPDNNGAGESVLTYSYGTTNSIDDRISRIRAMSVPQWTSQNIVSYERIGLDMTSLVNYEVPAVQLDRTYSNEGKRRAVGYTTQAAGVYPGWDRFGRVRRQSWVDTSTTRHDVSTTLPNIPPIFEETHKYDWASSKLAKTDARPGATWGNRDSRVLYDALDRLRQLNLGVQGPSSFTFAANGSQKWSLDMLGNWNSIFTDTSGDDTFSSGEEEVRAHNMANELLSRTRSPLTKDVTSDAAGNVRTIEPFGSLSENHTFTYDAWNRLVKVEQMNTTPVTDKMVGIYAYNGLNWRTIKDADTQTPVGLDQRRIMFYSASWQLLTEYVDDYTNNTTTPSPSGVNRICQQVWGLRYIDDAVLRRVDTDADGSYEDEADGGEPNGDPATEHAYWHVTDAQFSTVAMLGRYASVEERVRYSAYGVATFRIPADVNNDGAVNSADSTILSTLAAANSNTGTPITDPSYNADADINRDGQINDDDVTFHGALPQTTGSSNQIISRAAGPDNVIGYCGYVYNVEFANYHVRHRVYAPDLGRWMTRDPLEYAGGMSLHAYVANPLSASDWSGLLPPPSWPAGPSRHIDYGNPVIDFLTKFVSDLHNNRIYIQQALQEIMKHCDMKDPAMQKLVKDAVNDMVLSSVNVTTAITELGLEGAAYVGKLSDKHIVKLLGKVLGKSFVGISLPLDILGFFKAFKDKDQWRGVFKFYLGIGSVGALILIGTSGAWILGVPVLIASGLEAIGDGYIAYDLKKHCDRVNLHVCNMWKKQLQRLLQKKKEIEQRLSPPQPPLPDYDETHRRLHPVIP